MMSKNKRTYTVGAIRTPTPSALKAPILEILADGKMWQFMEIVEELANRLNLTKYYRERERLPNGDDRLLRYCAKSLRSLRDQDRLVENPARGSWRIISLTDPKKTKQLLRSSKSHNSDPMLTPVKKDLINDKETKIRNRSRRKSYVGKDIALRWIPQRKQNAIEPARVREPKIVEPVQEVKPIDNVTPTDTNYTCRTIAFGLIGLLFLIFSILIYFFLPLITGTTLGLMFFIIGLLFMVKATNSRGGW